MKPSLRPFFKAPGDSFGASNRLAQPAAETRRRFLHRFGAMIGGLAASGGLLRALLGDRWLLAAAGELVRNNVVVDLHCHANALGAPHFPGIDPALPEQMKTGAVDCAVVAVRGDYPLIRRDPSGRRLERRPAKPGELYRRTREQLDRLLEAANGDRLGLARSPQEIIASKSAGIPAVMLAIEGGDPLEGELARIQEFHDRGVRVLQLVHFRINEIGDIQTASPKHNGLTVFGRSAVRELNRLGMVIDTAHCSPATLRDVLAESRQPVILSHTGPAALRKSSRHLDDDTLLALAKRNGLVGIWPSIRRDGALEDFLNAIDHVKTRIGVDHVAVGSDVNGLRGATAIPTHKSFPLIAAGLLRRGYSEADAAKIVGGNCMRLFHQVKETRS